MDSGPRGRGLMAQGPGFLGTVATSPGALYQYLRLHSGLTPLLSKGNHRLSLGGFEIFPHLKKEKPHKALEALISTKRVHASLA